MGAKDPQKLYDERVRRVADQVALRETDRVPFVFATRFWAASLAGITFERFMYDTDAAIDATRDALRLVDPDQYSSSIYSFGKAMEALDYKPMEWPGHGTDANATFQYLDEEFMPAADYDDFLFDPTGYYIHTYMPRIAGAYQVLKDFPDFPNQVEWGVITGVAAFANQSLQAGFQRLFQAGAEAAETIRKVNEFIAEMKAEGYPIASGGFCKAPYDHFVDAMRGSKGGMLDMFRHKDKLVEAMDKITRFLRRGVVEAAERSGCPYIFMPLHWGLDGFMSPDQFKTYYWPPLRDNMLYLIERGTVPTLLWEGNCTTRLELIGDIPAGKAVYWFEQTDLVRAKEVLGGTVCLRGNVPTSLLITGTPEENDAYCRNLIEKVGKGGGFILDGAASIPDEARKENVLAVANSVKKYAS